MFFEVLCVCGGFLCLWSFFVFVCFFLGFVCVYGGFVCFLRFCVFVEIFCVCEFFFRFCVFFEVLCVMEVFVCLFVCGVVFVVVVRPPQRDLGLFLTSLESPCGGLSLYLGCI